MLEKLHLLFFSPPLRIVSPMMLFVVPAAVSLSLHPAVLRPVGGNAGSGAAMRAHVVQHIPLSLKHFLFCLQDVCNYTAVTPRRPPRSRQGADIHIV